MDNDSAASHQHSSDAPQLDSPRAKTLAVRNMDWVDSSEFSARVEELMAKWHVPGLAIATTHNRAVSSKGFGVADLDSKQSCTPHTLFDIASSSKSLTAASVALLVEDEAYEPVQWTAKVSQLLPGDFVMSKDSYTEDITVEDMLSHRTGIPRADDSYLSTDDAEIVTRNLRNLEVAAPIRTKFMYCNMMFTVATYLIQKVTGQLFRDYLQEHLFQPLGMSSTNLGPDAAKSAGLADRIATGHYWNPETETYVKLPPHEQTDAPGAGGIITSVADYIKWVEALMHRDAPITEQIQRELIKPRIFENPDPDEKHKDPFTSWIGYGLGLEVYFYRGIKVVKHDGLYDGFGSTHFFLPDHSFGGVILANAEDGGDLVYVLQAELLDAFLQVPRAERPDWDALATRAANDDDKDEKAATLRRELDPAYTGTPQPHTAPLARYLGRYRHAGFRTLDVVVNPAHPARLRTEVGARAFWLDFEHIAGQTKFVAHLFHARSGEEEELAAEFRFADGEAADGEGPAVRLGVNLEEALEGLIWFDRV
nr:protein flp [Quercus suber]